MKLISFARVTKFGILNFWRNGWLSFVTTLIMALFLFSASLLVMLNVVLNLTLTSLKEKIDISVYFKPEVQEKDISGLKDEISAMRETKSLQVITKDEAIKIFNEKHKNDPSVIALLAELEENPFQISMIIKAQNPDDYAIISDRLKNPQYKKLIDKITYEDNKAAIQKISKISATIQKFGMAIGLVFGIIAMIFVFNTVRMTIFTQKEEIKIMRLVGATSSFIRMPFIIEGFLYGAIGSVINTGVLYFLLKNFSPKFLHFLGSTSFDLFDYFISHFWMILLWQIIFASILGIISSIVATWRYLRT